MAFADLDNDGDQDVYTVVGGAFEGDVSNNVLFENPIANNNYLILQLEGKATNRSAIGTRLELTLANGEKRYHWIGTGGSFGSNPLRAELGLGDATTVKRLAIHWPVGGVQVLEDLAGNAAYRVVQGGAATEMVEFVGGGLY